MDSPRGKQILGGDVTACKCYLLGLAIGTGLKCSEGMKKLEGVFLLEGHKRIKQTWEEGKRDI